MVQEEKKLLLLKDLFARLPYGVKILHKGWNYEWDDELSTVERIVGIDDKFIYTKVIDMHNGEEYRDDKWPVDTFDDKLFLRPMSSMTEEEILHIQTLVQNKNHELYSRIEECGVTGTPDWKLYEISYIRTAEEVDYLNSRHLDWRGLIDKGLALEAPEGMY